MLHKNLSSLNLRMQRSMPGMCRWMLYLLVAVGGYLPWPYFHLHCSLGSGHNGQDLSESSTDAGIYTFPFGFRHVPDDSHENKLACETHVRTAKKLIIAVTPTYVRASQAIHIQHIVNVMRVVPPPVLWIVVESMVKTEETAELLQRTAGKCMHVGSGPECTTVNYVHLASTMKHENRTSSRGVYQRNEAIEYIEKNKMSGIVYFMDDDNAYAPELFQEMRKVEKVGIWPVGFLMSQSDQKLTQYPRAPMVERPLVREAEGRLHVIGWETFGWAARAKPEKKRKYLTDMAGFAFNSELLWTPTSTLTKLPKHPVRFQSERGKLETQFLERIIGSLDEFEPLADHCQDVFVWHIKFEANNSQPYPLHWRLPQPLNLIPYNKFSGDPSYLVEERVHTVANYTGRTPFGYKFPQKSIRG